MSLILEVKNMTVRVPDRYLLKGVHLTLNAGEILAIIGPNGAGKSTLLNALFGLIEKESGEIFFDGRPVESLSGLAVGYVPQYLEFDRTFPITVGEFVGLSFARGARLPLFFSAKEQAAVRNALKQVGALKLEPELMGHLSGGELQRVMLAKALIVKPKLLLLDEPATGIDIRGEDQFYKLIDYLRVKRNVGVLLISHDLNIVYKFATKVICLSQEVKCEGAPAKVLTMANLEKTYGGLVGVYHHHD